MCDALVWSFDAVTSVNWLEFLKAVAPVGTAIIAFMALQNWRRQDKAKREIEFLDQLLDAAHAYIAELSKPIIIWRITKVGMVAYAPPGATGDDTDRARQGAVSYIQSSGTTEGKRMFEALESLQPSLVKLRSLQTKGQVFQFEKYADAYNAVELLAWQFSRFESLAYLVSSTSLNFAHPEVQKLLHDLVAIEADAVQVDVAKHNKTLITFTQAAYAKLYGPPPRTPWLSSWAGRGASKAAK